MYTHQEFEEYSATLRELGITDEAQILEVLEFVYRLAVIAADEYEENLKKQNGTPEETQEQSGPDQRGQESRRNLDSSKHKGSGRKQSKPRNPGKGMPGVR